MGQADFLAKCVDWIVRLFGQFDCVVSWVTCSVELFG